MASPFHDCMIKIVLFAFQYTNVIVFPADCSVFKCFEFEPSHAFHSDDYDWKLQWNYGEIFQLLKHADVKIWAYYLTHAYITIEKLEKVLGIITSLLLLVSCRLIGQSRFTGIQIYMNDMFNTILGCFYSMSLLDQLNFMVSRSLAFF